MSVGSADGHQIIGAQSEGHQILGNNFSAGGDNIININNPADERKKCLIALFTTNPVDDRAKYLSFKGEVIGAAFHWVLESPIYQEWLKASSGSQLLWLNGGPGMGKTMLSIYLSSELEKLPDCHVLYYFCESRDPKRNTPVSLLRGLIYTLVRQRPALMNYLLPDYEVQQSALFSPDSIEALWRIFTQMVNDPETGRVYCVIDALDECHADGEHLEHILKKFRSYFAGDELSERLGRASLASGLLKLALISRQAPQYLASELGDFQKIPLDVNTKSEDGAQSKDVNSNSESQSLQIYIDAKLDELVSHHEYDEQTKASLRQALQARGDGTFLWVDMAIAQLSKSSSVDPLQVSLPDGAVGMYSLTLLQLPEGSIKLATSILRWVAVAFQPLTLAEINALGEIIYGREEWFRLLRGAVEDNKPQKDGKYTYIEHAISLCKNLLDMNADGEVKLVHETAKAFLVDSASPLLSDPRLVNFHVDEAVTHGEIAQASISYLETSPYTKNWVHLITVDDGPNTRNKIEANQTALNDFPLLLYATVHWPAHLRQARRASVKFDSPFFTSGGKLLQNWWSSAWSYIYHREAEEAVGYQSLIHIAAFFDLVEIAEHLSQKTDIMKLMEKRNGELDEPPFTAVRQGSTKVMEFFLDHGAKRSHWGKLYVVVACRRGHLQLVKMLLDRGESPNALDSGNSMVRKGLMGLIRHAPQSWVDNYATIFEDRDDVERLTLARLNYGASVTGLQAAASAGQEEIARFLLQHGADVQTATETGWTAVHFAAYAGQPNIIKLLLDHRASLNAVTTDGWSPLHCSAWHGKVAGINCLLDHGLQADPADKKGNTPLHVAADRGQIGAVRALLERGARRDLKNSRGLTPLQIATTKANADMIRVLEETK